MGKKSSSSIALSSKSTVSRTATTGPSGTVVLDEDDLDDGSCTSGGKEASSPQYSCKTRHRAMGLRASSDLGAAFK